MSSLLSKALVYLGLVDEDVSPAEPEVGPGEASLPPSRPAPRTGTTHVSPNMGHVEGRRVEPPAASTRVTALRPEIRGVRTVGATETQSDILVVEEFADAKILADRVRDRVPVVLDLRIASPDLVRRVIDFSSGLIYALDGTMRKVGEGLVLVLPPQTTLSLAEKRRLASLGAYELPIES